MKAWLALAALLLHLVTAAASTPPHFAVQVLQPNTGYYRHPLALNNDGQFLTVYVPDHPVPLFAETNFVDFNNKGEQLWWSYRDCCDYVIKHPFLVRNGQVTWEDGLTAAYALNDSSVIAGTYMSPGGQQHAVLFDGTTYKDLGTLGGATSVATDVNNHGQAIGSADTASGSGHPFLYQDGQMLDLSTRPGWIGQPAAINDLGQMVVSYRDDLYRLAPTTTSSA
ncbi:MAG: hypothetical protein ACXU8N_06660 [Telluria sp.]